MKEPQDEEGSVGQWSYKGKLKKKVINCDECGSKTELTEEEKFYCKQCKKIFNG